MSKRERKGDNEKEKHKAQKRYKFTPFFASWVSLAEMKNDVSTW